MADADALKVRRAVYKRKVTLALNKADVAMQRGAVTEIAALRQEIQRNLDQVRAYDESMISQLLDDKCDEKVVDAETLAQSNYSTDIEIRLRQLKDGESERKIPVAPPSMKEVRLPELKCELFSGEGVCHMKYFTFLTKFNNLVGNRPNLTNSAKLTYLKSYLTGYALKIVEHISINDVNYKVALELLDKSFLNKGAVLDQLCERLLTLECKYNPDFSFALVFVNEVRGILSDLKIFECDVLNEKSANIIVSHIIFAKLPVQFKRELVRKVDNNYPSLNNIFDHHVDVVETLKVGSFPRNVRQDRYKNSGQSVPKSQPEKTINPRPVFSNTAVATQERKTCKFCLGLNHSMLHCPVYSTHQSRVDRCKELKLCASCSSSRHNKIECKTDLDYQCRFCLKKNHISALCNKMKLSNTVSSPCLNSSSDSKSVFILPTITFSVGRGNKRTNVHFLIDSGSQRSYVAGSVLSRIDFPKDLQQTIFTVNTFLEKGSRNFAEISLNINLLDGTKNLQAPILVDKNFSMSYEVSFLREAINNLSAEYDLADVAYSNLVSESVQLEGILGVDIIQCFSDFRLVSCMAGTAFLYNNKLVPSGNVAHYLTKSEVAAMYRTINYDKSKLNSYVNSVLNPVSVHPDPIGSITSESEVEGHLDRIFQMEAIGIPDDDVNAYSDAEIVESFKQEIKFHDGKYHVSLPWNEKIEDVKSNFYIAKAVLNRVEQRLEKKGLLEAYGAVFDQQLNDGIIEEIPVSECVDGKKVFIPHREVVREEVACTTKIRPVLNCSFKTGKSPSLNEAAFPGIDLMGNLFTLLVNLRQDDYLAISDIRKAFLQVRLERPSDRDKFCILWKKQGQLIAYRYKTIVFGFISSPFVLNFVIKHHLTKYPSDLCSYFLSNCLYVDNLFMTGNDPVILETLYRDAYRRMSEGGFDLRSWNSNCETLNDKFRRDGVAADHGGLFEKVLGYKYNVHEDSLCLSSSITESAILTKRIVLSGLAKCFDPLGLVSPVTLRGKSIMREIWRTKLSWDEVLPVEICESWQSLHNDMSKLNSVTFNRRVMTTDSPVKLVVFSDSSQKYYGFSVYALTERDGVSANLVFSKNKIAPLKKKTLPTLELLGVYLAFKCIFNLMNSLGRVPVLSVIFATDSQIVLSWLLNGKVKAKNIFASNRVKDVLSLKRKFEADFGLVPEFKYVPTDLNPADLLTRGLTFREFQNKLEFWKHGPSFLTCDTLVWPESDLRCIPNECKSLIACPVVTSSDNAVFPVNRYSTLSKLLSITTRLFKWLNYGKFRVRRRQYNCNESAREYWLRHEQRKYYSQEYEFLKLPDKLNVTVPPLVKDLHLFLDENDLIRSRGRLARCAYIPYDVANPILISRDSFLTTLIVRDCHVRSKHMGVSSTMATLRNSGLWLPRGRPVIKRVLRECILCKRYNTPSFRYPKPTDFNKDKVNYVRPFAHVGVDFTGHFHVKMGEKFIKMYLIIFTCLSIRAIHLELVPEMSTYHFLSAFIRFTTRFGFPVSLYSDNALSFKQAAELLTKSSKNNDFSEFLEKNSIKHIRIPLYSAWFGSAWERLIRVVKSCLYKTIGRSTIEYFFFITLIAEVQDSINSRPLTYQDTSDVNHEFITPNSFLKFGNSSNITFGSSSGDEVRKVSRSILMKTLELREDSLDKFRDLWYTEYLLSLRRSGKDSYEPVWEDKIKVDDVVLISSPVKPRPLWSLGRITKLFTGKDGKTRSVELIRPDRSSGVYAISHLYPMELSLDSVSSY